MVCRYAFSQRLIFLLLCVVRTSVTPCVKPTMPLHERLLQSHIIIEAKSKEPTPHTKIPHSILPITRTNLPENFISVLPDFFRRPILPHSQRDSTLRQCLALPISDNTNHFQQLHHSPCATLSTPVRQSPWRIPRRSGRKEMSLPTLPRVDHERLC